MDGSHKSTVFQKKPDTEEYILPDFIIIKFKNRQNQSVVLEIRTGVTLEGSGDQERFMFCFFILIIIWVYPFYETHQAVYL